MGNVWDYFMRRKPLLLAIFGVIIACAVWAYALLWQPLPSHSSPDSATESSFETDPTVEPGLATPETAETTPAGSPTEPLPRLHLQILNPGEIAYRDLSDTTSTSSAEEVEVPLTGTPNLVKTWYNVVVLTTLDLVLGLIAVAAARLLYTYYSMK